jgi:L-amino acid N-acyltransferase YncA
MLSMRPAVLADLDDITAIYNEAIVTTTATFDTEPKTRAEQEAWFSAHDEKYPVMVAEQAGAVVAWASLSRWSDRCAYADTAEISLYVAPCARGQGIGTELTRAILAAGEQGGLHTVVARVAGGNAASLRILEKLEFRHIGVMREVGRKFGQLLDVTLLQLIYGPSPGAECG